MTTAGLTLSQLAHRLDLPHGAIAAILGDLRAAGLAEDGEDGRWRISALAELRSAKVLRELLQVEDEA